jgi:guanylate kinase
MSSRPVRGVAFVISGPAGAGKTTLVEMLVADLENMKESISCTTRAPRGDEEHDKHYLFLSPEEFEEKVQADQFLEHVQLFDCAYGTLRRSVVEDLEQGNHVAMVIDTQGALQVKRNFPAKLIFVSPPSMEVLEARLVARKTETPAKMAQRLKRAEKELLMAPHYDYHIINEDLETAYQVLRSIVVAEVHQIDKEERSELT